MDPIAISTGLISALGGLLGLLGGLCACIVPVVLLIGSGIFIYHRRSAGAGGDQAIAFPRILLLYINIQ